MHLLMPFMGLWCQNIRGNTIERLGRPYEYTDVEHISRKQLKEYDDSMNLNSWVFFDTWLIITRVWFEIVFGHVPGWMDEKIREARFDLVLLCAPDIPWISDQVRENGGQMRDTLFDKYKAELDRFGLDWFLVSGSGTERQNMAIKLINRRIPNVTT